MILLSAKRAELAGSVVVFFFVCGGLSFCRSDSEGQKVDTAQIGYTTTTTALRNLQFTFGRIGLDPQCTVACELVVDAMHGLLECPSAPAITLYSGLSSTVGVDIQPGFDGYEMSERTMYGLFHIGTPGSDSIELGVDLIANGNSNWTGITHFHTEDRSDRGRRALLRLARSFQLDSEQSAHWCTEN